MSSCLCSCCRSRPEESGTGDADSPSTWNAHQPTETAHVMLSVQAPGVGHCSSSVRLRGELDDVRQQKQDETQSQQQTVSSSLKQHSHRMDDMKSGHDTEMSEMRQSNRETTMACSATMTKMKVNNQREMNRNMADHHASMAAMRQSNDGVEVKRNENVNVVKLANAQRVTNMRQRLDAQRSDFKQKQHASEMMHSQRMKMMSFSNIGMASDARNHNAIDLKAQRQGTRTSRLAQQGKVDAANQRHHHDIDEEKLRHGHEMSEMKTSSDSKTATHETKMGRMNDKNQHKSDDGNHMALQFMSLESKLKRAEARCAEHEQALAENAQTVLQSQRRHDLLVAQSEVITAAKDVINKDGSESAEQKAAVNRKTFGRDCKDEELRFLRNKIQKALDSNHAFDEEMTTFLTMLSELNEQIRTD